LNLNYFTHLQNQYDINGNPTECFLAAQKLLAFRDQVKAFRMLACKELREHIEMSSVEQQQQQQQQQESSPSCKTADDSTDGIKAETNGDNNSIGSNSSNGCSPTPIDDEASVGDLTGNNNNISKSQNLSNNNNNNLDESNGNGETNCFDGERMERLLMRIGTLKKINISIMEELFFNDVIGNVQIDSIIPSIIGSDENNAADADAADDDNADMGGSSGGELDETINNINNSLEQQQQQPTLALV
jgi:hypothetical protein